MPGDDQAAVRVDRRDVRRVDAPQRVAQVLGQAERLAELARRVDRLAGGGVERGHLEEDPSVGDRHAGEDRARRWRRRCRRRSSRPRRARRALRCACCRRSPRRPRRCSRSACSWRRSSSRAARPRARSSCRAPTCTPASSTTRPPIRRVRAIRQSRSTSAEGITRPSFSVPASMQTKPSPMRAADRGRDRALEDVERALEVALGRPDVEPVALADVAVQALADEPREHVALDRGRLLGREQVEHRALEHVDAGGDVARVDLVRRRLLDEAGHLAVARACARARRRTGPRPA